MIVNYGKTRDLPRREAVRGIVFKGTKIGIADLRNHFLYMYPGGGIDEGEKPEEAVVREMLEEAGLRVKVNKHLVTFIKDDLKWLHTNHIYLCDVLEEGLKRNLTEQEVELGLEFSWIEAVDLYSYYLKEKDLSALTDHQKSFFTDIHTRGFLTATAILRDKEIYKECLKQWIGKKVEVYIDRPIGHNDYLVNYGELRGDFYSLDGDKMDAYVIGPKEPLKSFKGEVIGVVRRYNDLEEKLVVANKKYSKAEIEKEINFLEKYFDSEVIVGDE